VGTAFFTGATGFVGSHAARFFLSRGWKVKALVRRPDRPGLLPAGVEIVAGDLVGDRYRKALEGADAIVHVAGTTKARSLEDYAAANVLGTEALVRAASESAASARFVLVSSQSAAGPSRRGEPVREKDAPEPVSWYGISKLEGERAVERGWKASWTIVRPSVVYGAGDPGLVQLFATVAGGWAPVIAGGRRRIQLIWATDLARVLFAAATRPDLAGRRGFAAGPPVTMAELVEFVASLRRPPARRVPVPALAIRGAGWIESFRETLTGRSRPFNRDKAREILQPDWVCDAEPFLRDAGIAELRAWREGIAETIGWYQREGWIRPAFGEL
jgi:nucleoside-diphosphate-sugar epimerase